VTEPAIEPDEPAELAPEPDEPDEPAGGGESACALHRVCDVCGGLPDGPPLPACGRCGAVRDR
jgi:hypothetical protein